MRDKIHIRADRGLTLTSLIVTVMVLAILVGASLTIGTGILDTAKFENIRNGLVLIQNKCKIKADEYAIGEIEKEELYGKNYGGWYLLSDANLTDMGLQDLIKYNVKNSSGEVVDGFYIDYNTCDVAYGPGVLYEGKRYYTLYGIDSKDPNDTFDQVIRSGRYILFEVYDHIVGDSGVLNEISIFDKNGKKINYSIIENEAYDSQQNNVPYYWIGNKNDWHYSNLYDGQIDYSGPNTCIFTYSSGANKEKFARFIIDLGEEKEISRISVCIGNSGNRMPKEVSAYFIDNYTNKTYEKNVKQRNNEGLTLIKTIEFTETITTPTWYSFMGQETYLLVEVYDHIGRDSAVLNEIEILNKYGEKVPYNVVVDEAYDSVRKNIPYDWKGTWNYSNLYDEQIAYAAANTCIFTYSSGINTNKFARFILKVESTDIEDIRVNIGNSDSRMPKEVSIFSIDNYSDKTYENNVKIRNNGGLTLIKNIKFDTIITTPTWYSFMGQERYLLFEVYDHIAGNAAVLNEIELLNKYGEKIAYSVITKEAFDSARNDVPYDWTGTWNYSNLYDYEYTYAGANTCIFTYSSTANTGKFARFIIKAQERDIRDIRVNIGNTDSRTPKSISVYYINRYSEETYERNLKTRNDKGLSLIKVIDFDTVVTQPTWYSFMKNADEKKILFEIYDHIGGNGVSIAEIQILDKGGRKIPYNVMPTQSFDSTRNGIPQYWNNASYWGYTRLYDSRTLYSGYNCAYFINSTANTSKFVRFILSTENVEIGDIKVCFGDTDSRTPKSISAYTIDNYSDSTYENNVKQRNNEGLTLIKTKEFDTIMFTPTWYSLE